MKKNSNTLKGFIECGHAAEVYQIWDIDVNNKEIVLQVLTPDLACFA